MKLICCIFVLFGALESKELFKEEMIAQYLIDSNPFFYETIANEKRLQNRDQYYTGELDHQLYVNYDKKQYPLSDGEFVDAGIKKPFENGIDLSLSYRKAQDVQEYNNIKTGDEGEVLVGLKLPVVSLIQDTHERMYNINTAVLERQSLRYASSDNFRQLYYTIILEYAKVLYLKSIITLQEELLEKAKKRKRLIDEKIKAGSLAEISEVEARQQIINREQSLRNSLNDYFVGLEKFVQYLNIAKDEFESRYDLPDITLFEFASMNRDALMQKALQNRFDLKKYDVKLKQINLKQKQTSLLNLPKANVAVYGVHDKKYDDEGYKLSFDMSFPLQRRKFDAKDLENKKEITQTMMAKEKALIQIKTNLKNILGSYDMLMKNYQTSQEEITLLERLESVENKKYILGTSNLFMLNQREMYTLKIKKKALLYKYKLFVLQKEAQKETGVF